MAALDVHRVLDLRLLVDEEAEELLGTELKPDGVSIGVRSKVRLLMSATDGASRQERLPGDQGDPTQSATRTAWGQRPQRRLQGDEGDGGVSFDTIAIVLSVLVGAAGYVVQVSCNCCRCILRSL